LCWLCGWGVNVAALGGVARVRKKKDGPKKRSHPHDTSSSIAATSHKRGLPCLPLQHVQTLRGHRAYRARRTSTRPSDFSVAIGPQHSAASHTPTAFNCMHCSCLLRAFLLVLLVHCILPASFCTLEYATQNLQTQSNAVLHCHHTAKQTSMRLPRNSTDIIHMPFSFFPFSCARFQHYASLILRWQEKRRV
jgi:hypothetical protein